MEEIIFPEYLRHPLKVKKALELLDEGCSEPNVFKLFSKFNHDLGVRPGEVFPITRAFLGGKFGRARINNEPLDFLVAKNVSDIGPRLDGIRQGRANPVSFPVFYASNSKETSSFEVLQEKNPGLYKITIGCWTSPRELCVANLLDGLDPDLSNLTFAHSMPRNYVKEWPKLEGQSALILLDYFREKFKMTHFSGLYNITNVIAGVCYSLAEVDGIGYASVSNQFKGYNIVLKDFSMLACESVEEWEVRKVSKDFLEHKLLRKGSVETDGSIIWNPVSSQR